MLQVFDLEMSDRLEAIRIQSRIEDEVGGGKEEKMKKKKKKKKEKKLEESLTRPRK